MDGPVVVAVVVAGLLAGLLVAEAAARLPEPAEVSPVARGAIAVVNAAAWGVAAAHWERWWQVGPYALLASTLVCVSAIDLRTYRIPNKVVFPVLGVSLVVLLVATDRLGPPGGTWEYLRGALVGAAIYFALLFVPHLIYPKGMGMGDVKLALVMGLYLGWGHTTLDAFGVVTSALLVGCILGVLFGLIVNVVRKQGGAFPFGPSLAVGCFVMAVQATVTPLT